MAAAPAATQTASPIPAPSAAGRWWQIALYPAVFPAVFVIQLWSDSLIHPVWIVRPLLLAVVAALLVTLVLTLIAGNRDVGALGAWALIIGLIIDDLRVTVLFAAIGIGIAIVGRWRRRDWPLGLKVTRALSAVSAALLAVTLASSVLTGSVPATIDDVRLDLANAAPAATYDADAPDIWLILLDGFPGDDAADEVAPADYDKDAMADALAARGFAVQRRSQTNYPVTRLVLPSMLDGRLLADEPTLQAPFGSNDSDAARLRRVADDGDVLKLLGAAGYERIAISSGWGHLGMRRVDRVVDPPEMTEFESVLARSSGIGLLLDVVSPSMTEDQQRGRVSSTLAAAESLAAEPHDRPRFVFVHVPAPHPPFVFGPAGQPLDGGPSSSMGRAEYLAGIERTDMPIRTFANATHVGQMATTTIDRILAASDRPPVIVVFSDHGSEVRFNGMAPSRSDQRERMSSILALLSPGRPTLFPPGTTPVNVLPRLLNAYLGTHMAIQPDSLWTWRDGGSVLDLVQLDRASLQPVASP